MLAVCAVAFFLVPMISNQEDIFGYYESSFWVEFSTQATLVVFMVCAAVIGETNAITNEKIYFLSKPINRSVFLLAKCVSTIVVSLTITILGSLMLAFVAIYCILKNHVNIFNDTHVGLTNKHGAYMASIIFGSYILLTIAGGIISTIYKYQVRGGVCIIMCAIAILIYTILFPTFVKLYQEDFNNHSRLLFISLPLGIYPLLTLITTPIGWVIFLKSEVES
ncbi:MAG: hypothetical protein LBG49_02860 [Mycoplasmataceae bacterium]|nr:hypothetical protein [Mycoplasmataceae bacterium]